MKNSHWIALLCVAFATMFLCACGDGTDSTEQSVLSVEDAPYPAIFKPADEEYPYAGIPRIVIETENRQAIKDRETEIPAKLQIWGEKEAESEVLDLTIRGRGNTSWTDMPKKSYKIEFEKKQSMLGMPKDKDWALIANYADKTLMRNFIAYRLSAALGAYYAPRCEFAELYLNGEYLGVYLLTETIKVGKKRIDLSKDDDAYIVEFDAKYRADEQVVFSDVLTDKDSKQAFKIHYPQNATEASLKVFQNYILKFENFLKSIKKEDDNDVETWIDVDESIKYYWVEELSKNPDSWFYTSVFFSWTVGDKVKMGPVWDFDLAFGNYYYVSNALANKAQEWNNRSSYWYKYLFKDSKYKQKTKKFWTEKRTLIKENLDSIDVYERNLKNAKKNDFKKWKISESDNAVKILKEWIYARIEWIDSQEK